MSHQRVIQALKAKGCRKGSGWLCPNHDDHRPSLSVKEGKDGRTLLKCHSGCSTEGVVRTLGMTMAVLFGDNGRGDAASRIVITYDYKKGNGELLYQVCRLEPKGFRCRRPDGDTGWIWNLKGVRRVLLPRVGYFLFYRVARRRNELQVLAFWHAQRGASPKL